MATLKDWWKRASKEDQDQLAKACGVGHWSVYARTVPEGKRAHRAMTVELADALERASEMLHRISGGRLPLMKREELCDTCSSCPHYLAARREQKAA